MLQRRRTHVCDPGAVANVLGFSPEDMIRAAYGLGCEQGVEERRP